MSQIGNAVYPHPYGRNQMQDAMSAQNAASPAKPSEFELLKNEYARALAFLHSEAAAIEEIYARIAGGAPGQQVSQLAGGAGLTAGSQAPAGHLSILQQLSADIHKRIAATSETVDKLRALV